MKAIIGTFLVSAFFIFGCTSKMKTLENKNSNEKTSIESHTAKNSLDYIGIYFGTMPCADCEGIVTTLQLLDDSIYILKTVYLGKNMPAEFISEGTFSWNEAGNTITLSGVQDAPSQFFVAENELIQLDRKGKRIKGDLADLYRLKKKDSTAVTSILNTKWKLVELNGKPIGKIFDSEKEMFLQFHEDNRYSAFAGCNNLMGGFELKENQLKIKFTKGISTLMACPDMETEQEFGLMLETVDNFSLKGNQMTLNKARMAPLAIFEAIK